MFTYKYSPFLKGVYLTLFVTRWKRPWFVANFETESYLYQVHRLDILHQRGEILPLGIISPKEGENIIPTYGEKVGLPSCAHFSIVNTKNRTLTIITKLFLIETVKVASSRCCNLHRFNRN